MGIGAARPALPGNGHADTARRAPVLTVRAAHRKQAYLRSLRKVEAEQSALLERLRGEVPS